MEQKTLLKQKPHIIVFYPLLSHVILLEKIYMYLNESSVYNNNVRRIFLKARTTFTELIVQNLGFDFVSLNAAKRPICITCNWTK